MLSDLRRSAAQVEDGSSLILALIIVAILAIGAAAILSFADTSIRATVAVQAQGAASYSADAALQAAINLVRSGRDSNGNLYGVSGTYLNPPGGNNCPTITVTVNTVTSTVTCQPADTSGQVTLVNNPSNDPGYAVLTLATSTTSGIFENSNNNIAVNGPVFVNSTIDFKNAVVWDVTGSVSANGCLEKAGSPGAFVIHPSGSANCSAGSTMRDPGFATSTFDPLITTTSTPAPPKCINNVNVFSPGTYSTLASLAPVRSSCKIGGQAYATFTPGNYYFNYPGTWTPPYQQIVGGVPVGSAPGTDCDSTQPGVQWVFGGDSAISLFKQQLFICAPALTANRQQISIYGLTSRAASPLTPETGVNADSSPSNNLLAISGPGSRLVVRGTVYAPRASFDVELSTSSADTIFNRGILAYSLNLSLTAGVSSGGTINVPPPVGTPVSASRTVLFTVINSGRVRGKAVVQFDDVSTPTVPGSNVTVTSWSVYR